MNEIVKIDKYLEILREQLNSFGLKSNQKILDNIRLQMLSILKHWNDVDLRNVILLFGREEAQHYLPSPNIDIKAFVVVAIRNSLIETAGSQFYKENGFEIQLDDYKHMPLITKKAISYFKDVSLFKICEHLSDININDYYYNIIKEFPLTYKVLSKISNTKKLELHFEKIQCNTVDINYDVSDTYTNKGEGVVIEDGYSNKFNDVLINMLEEIKRKENDFFFADSFKYVSRNFEKNFKIIQCLLQSNSSFVTFNYFISNGLVSKRKELLKPAHNTNELVLKLKNMNGISAKHKRVLEMYK